MGANENSNFALIFWNFNLTLVSSTTPQRAFTRGKGSLILKPTGNDFHKKFE